MFARIVLAAVLLAAATGTLAQAQAAAQHKAKLAAGDPAPALTIEKWVKGAPLNGFEKGKIYVVECWATWCGPCIKSMPHLSELQRQYGPKGVTVIGVTSPDNRGSTLERVETLVAQKGDGMAYTVAWDEDGGYKKDYMEPAGQTGIPCSFLIDGQGKIAFIGHPMNLDIPLAEVVAGTWDVVAGSAKVAEANSKLNEIFKLSRTDPKAALAKIEEYAIAYPVYADNVELLKFDVALATGDDALVSSVGASVVDKAIAGKNDETLNEVAWKIVDPKSKREQRDLDLALRAAQNAAAFTQEKDASVLDTLARVHFLRGDVQKAIELQEKAIAVADENDRDALRGTLQQYKEKGV